MTELPGHPPSKVAFWQFQPEGRAPWRIYNIRGEKPFPLAIDPAVTGPGVQLKISGQGLVGLGGCWEVIAQGSLTESAASLLSLPRYSGGGLGRGLAGQFPIDRLLHRVRIPQDVNV